MAHRRQLAGTFQVPAKNLLRPARDATTMRGFPRDVLLRYRWTDGLDIAQVTVEFVSRGMPGDVETVRGSEIMEIGRGSFSLGHRTIPYHRVLRVLCGTEALYSKKGG